MPRRRRPYLPGAVFHLTARTQGREHWFDAPMRDVIRDAMALVQQQTDAKLRAYVIMSNHLHVLLQQGRRPLASFMQPLLCRVALAVKRKYKVEGHVFGRAYWDGVCADETYLRVLVQYIHANPVRAEMCCLPEEWRWSSHSWYRAGAACNGPVVEPIGTECELPVTNDFQLHGDAYKPCAMDLRDLLAVTLRNETGGCMNLFDLRSNRGREAARLRRLLIKRAAEAGYQGSAIANSLCVSETTVSKVVRSARIARPRLMAI